MFSFIAISNNIVIWKVEECESRKNPRDLSFEDISPREESCQKFCHIKICHIKIWKIFHIKIWKIFFT